MNVLARLAHLEKRYRQFSAANARRPAAHRLTDAQVRALVVQVERDPVAAAERLYRALGLAGVAVDRVRNHTSH
jgi:hypothetical protein